MKPTRIAAGHTLVQAMSETSASNASKIGGLLGVIVLYFLNYRHNYDGKMVASYRQRAKDSGTMLLEENQIDTMDPIKEAMNDGTCRRICPYPRKNRMYVYMGTAGLSDRLSVLHMLGKLAGYLCAVVELPPPKASLIDIHNNGKPLNKHLRWDDFYNMTFLQDGSPVFREAKENPNRSQYHADWSDKGFYDPSKYPSGWRLMISNRSSSLLEHYEIIQDWSWQFENDPDRGFLWEIHQSMYSCNLRKVKPLPGLLNTTALSLTTTQKYEDVMRPSLSSRACQYVDGAIEKIEPNQLHSFRKELQHRVRIRAPNATNIFGFLHIRRGDAKKTCNSTLPEMRQFLQCSLNGTRATGKYITLLMASDEHDQNYRQSVLDLVNQDDNGQYAHVFMLDADHIVEEMIADLSSIKVMPKRLLNNYYQFELLKGIGMQKSFDFSTVFLSKRRSDCPSCTNLVSSYPDVFQ